MSGPPPPSLRRLAVFCGARTGAHPAYAEAAHALGAHLAREGVGLVYGGGRVGLMGVLADAVLAGGGEVIGVIPQALVDREVAHTGLTTLETVGSMHERKARMVLLADAFAALPGGLGTLDELAEALTWGQLGLHAKPCGLLNAHGYFDGLVRFIAHAGAEGFIHSASPPLIQASNPEALLEGLRARLALHSA